VIVPDMGIDSKLYATREAELRSKSNNWLAVEDSTFLESMLNDLLTVCIGYPGV
jgi:hypothetical protein